ncbi:MAG TPA: EVE domain-containing protein [Candidatus Babeliales bacterium]|nr:EVE domain-containing protein [Candidatus Babeliales bacterium]
MAKYWIGVASREHVKGGAAGGFAQVCHGKGGPLNKMTAGDWIVYYSPVEIFGEKTACRKFTAIGRVQDRAPYEFRMSVDFIPWRRDVQFFAAQDAPIELLISALSFIKNKKQWGFPFRRGCFEIPESDFKVIADAMGVDIHE